MGRILVGADMVEPLLRIGRRLCSQSGRRQRGRSQSEIQSRF